MLFTDVIEIPREQVANQPIYVIFDGQHSYCKIETIGCDPTRPCEHKNPQLTLP